MENEENYIEFIENYLDNKLSLEETREFEQKCQENKEFNNLFLDIKLILPGIRYSTKKELIGSLRDKGVKYFSDENIEPYKEKADLIDLEKEYGVKISQREGKHVQLQNQSKQVYWFNSKTIGIAASIVLLIAAAYLFVSVPNSEKLYELAYNEIGQGPYTYINSDDENLTVVRGTEAEKIESLKQQAYNAYSLGQYSSSIGLFKEILLKGEEVKVKFYLGNAYLANDQPELAIVTFNEILEKNPGEFATRTKWYLGISFLKNKEMDKAKATFMDLTSSTNDSYKDKAEQILKEF